VLVTIFIDAIGFGLIIPVLPRLLMAVGGFGLGDAVRVAAWMGLAIAVASFFSAPVLGNLSDRFGRRPVLLIALSGLALDYLLLAVANTLPLIVLGRVLSGAFGGSYAPAQAAIAEAAQSGGDLADPNHVNRPPFALRCLPGAYPRAATDPAKGQELQLSH